MPKNNNNPVVKTVPATTAVSQTQRVANLTVIMLVASAIVAAVFTIIFKR